MAHLVEQMAYTGDTPWHGLGNRLPESQSIEVWARASGMNFDILDSSVYYQLDSSVMDMNGNRISMPFESNKVLYRSDNKMPLSVVSDRYKVVQPREVLEFYRDLTDKAGFKLCTAGVLKQGKKFWALASMDKETNIRGNDLVKGYLLLATSCDGTLATTVTPTSIRVVCNNTLEIATNTTSNAIKVPHNTTFNADAIKDKLGIAVQEWDEFMDLSKMLSYRKVNNTEARKFFTDILLDNTNDTYLSSPSNQVIASNDSNNLNNSSIIMLKDDDFKVLDNHINNNNKEPTKYQANILKKVSTMYQGQGRGADMISAKNTAWGLVCAVTEYIDHEVKARSRDNRLDSAWFGNGNNIKQRAFQEALKLAA